MFEQESTEHQAQREESQRLLAALRQGKVSRRDFVVRAAGLGFSGAVINLFLIACSTGGAPATTVPTVSTTSSATAAATTASVSTVSGASVTPTVSGIPGGASTATRSASPPVAATATRVATAGAATPVAGVPSTAIATARGTQLGGDIPGNAPLADKQELRYPSTELVHPDPGQATAVQEVQFILNCWDGLVTANEQGGPVPAHATKYDISADGLTYTFQLRSGLRFSDGSPLTAKDYAWTWKRNLNPDTASEYAQALYLITGAKEYNNGKTTDPNTVGVKATNDTTLVVTLVEPAPYFLALVATWPYVPLQQATI
ncbi:MAG TPA: ABC transporter substrate-binding protein, partial [Thermomicrobiales bacterium]